MLFRSGTLDAAAIEAVLEEAWPTVRDEDELFDVLQVMGWLTTRDGESWRDDLERLVAKGRVLALGVKPEDSSDTDTLEGWTTHEHVSKIQALFPQVDMCAGVHDASAMNNNEGDIPTPESAVLYVVQGWMPHIGPVTSKELSERLGVTHSLIHQGLLQLEGQGQVQIGRAHV